MWNLGGKKREPVWHKIWPTLCMTSLIDTHAVVRNSNTFIVYIISMEESSMSDPFWMSCRICLVRYWVWTGIYWDPYLELMCVWVLTNNYYIPHTSYKPCAHLVSFESHFVGAEWSLRCSVLTWWAAMSGLLILLVSGSQIVIHMVYATILMSGLKCVMILFLGSCYASVTNG